MEELVADLLPWAGRLTTSDQSRALRAIVTIWELDPRFGQAVVQFPWLADDVTYAEASALGSLAAITVSLPEFVGSVLSFPWFTDDLTEDEHSAISHLGDIAAKDIELATSIAGSPWFSDGVTERETLSLEYLDSIVSTDIEFARHLGRSPWFTDGWKRSLYFETLHSLARIAASPDRLAQLTAQPWIADGMLDDEAALVVTLGWVVLYSPELYADLLSTHYTQYRAVTLPIAGDVNIWVFQNTPFPLDEDLPTVIEDTARIGEELLGVPFPTSDAILLVVDRTDKRYRIWSGHYDTIMLLVRDGKVYHLPHETAHYWFYNPRTGPLWLTEGAAEFIAAYVEDRTGGLDLADRRNSNAGNFSTCVDYYQIENIRHLAVVLGNEWEIVRSPSCLYHMGEYFLHGASGIAGEEEIMSALGELHLSELGRRYATVEGRIFKVFSKHVPDNRLEEFRTFYRKVIGGASAFGDTEFSDDHGDEPESATPIAVGESIGGSLDYMWDFDYFRFQAQRGKKYHIRVDHDTLRPNSIGLYAPDGQTGKNRSWIARELVSTGPRIVWIASSSNHYYVAVHNYGGKTGRYTLRIDAADDAEDDHGDTSPTATNVSLGEIVQGTIDDDLDIDFFRFPVERDKKYHVLAIRVTLEEFQFTVRMPDGGISTADTENIRTCCPHGFQFIARGAGNASIAIAGLGESVGEYTFKVVPVDNRPGD